LDSKGLNKWFDEHVEPINKMLSEGEMIYGYMNHGVFWKRPEEPSQRETTHTALLINIQPIKKETAEDVLRDYFDYAKFLTFGNPKAKLLFERVKKVLGES